MVRTLVLTATLVGLSSCRQTPSTDLLGRAANMGARIDHTASPVLPPSASQTLAARHRVPVTIERSIPIAGGEVVVYAYGRLDARLAELAAAGHDVVAELAVVRDECERALEEPELQEPEWIELEYRKCKERAASLLLDDDQITPECRTLAVAYLDPQGEVLDRLEPSSACLVGVGSVETYDLTPRPDDELMLIATYETLGALTLGGWGVTEESAQLHVLATEIDREADAPRLTLVEQLRVALTHRADSSPCGGGFHRSVRVASLGTIEVFSQAWNECGQEDCIDPDDEEAQDVDPSMICQPDPVIAERSTWQAELGAWGEFEPRGFDGTELPDGIMQ